MRAIVVFPTASEELDTGAYYRELLGDYGARNVVSAEVRSREEAADPELAVQRQLVGRKERRAARLAHFGCVCDVVVVAVRQGHVRHALDRVVEIQAGVVEGRVSFQERVDHDDGRSRLDAKRRMAEPGDFHETCLQCVNGWTTRRAT